MKLLWIVVRCYSLDLLQLIFNSKSLGSQQPCIKCNLTFSWGRSLQVVHTSIQIIPLVWIIASKTFEKFLKVLKIGFYKVFFRFFFSISIPFYSPHSDITVTKWRMDVKLIIESINFVRNKDKKPTTESIFNYVKTKAGECDLDLLKYWNLC